MNDEKFRAGVSTPAFFANSHFSCFCDLIYRYPIRRDFPLDRLLRSRPLPLDL